MKSNVFLCIHRGHGSSCAIIKDGKVLVAAQEERFSRIKNDIGFPFKSLTWALAETGLKASDFKQVGYTTKYFPSIYTKSKHRVNFDLDDYRNYYSNEGKLKTDFEYKKSFYKYLRDDSKFNRHESYYDFSYLTDDNVLVNEKLDRECLQKEQVSYLVRTFGFKEEQIIFLDHHTCHAYYAYFASEIRDQKCVVLTMDAGGDGMKQSVWIADKNKLTLLENSNENELAKIYKLTTLVLGLRPDEDEYKVMGLAPYSSVSKSQKILKIFESLLKIEGMSVVHDQFPPSLWGYLREKLTDERFDSVAGGLQLYTEKILSTLCSIILDKLDCKSLVFSGGVSLNVKANKVLTDLDSVESFFVAAAGGDESLSIGGCYFMSKDFNDPQSLSNIYTGFDVSKEISTFDFDKVKNEFKVTFNILPGYIAKLISGGEIIARMSGRTEFGPRALGNRSILAHPGLPNIKEKINKLVKKRDFWMPFALTIMADKQNELIVNGKDIKSPFMTTAFDSLEVARRQVFNGMHPYDYTIRPQLLLKHANEAYYAILKEFNTLTGIPAILNTSFNLHGLPVCNSIEDGIDCLRKSDLKYLLIENTLLEKINNEKTSSLRREL